MLRGNVDSVTATKISGWAADSDFPDQIVEVSIYRDDAKIAQIRCEKARADLANLGVYGQGAHGFSHDFDGPLAEEEGTKLTVRFTATGTPLSPGELVFSCGKIVPLQQGARERQGEPSIPMPRDPRGLLLFLALFEEKAGLYELLTRLQFDGQRPRDIWYSVFGEPYPQGIPTAFGGAYSPRDDLYACLMSPRFQTDLIPFMLQAFPEKKRLFFVHVPKCAGTDLIANFKLRHPCLDRGLLEPAWSSKAEMLRRLGRLAVFLPLCESLFVSGHTRLKYYTDLHLIRPHDRVFTIIRNPIAMVISQINYILTRIASDSETGRAGPDTLQWLNMLGTQLPREPMSPGLVTEVVRKAIYHRDIIVKNSTCFWLGEGNAQSALSLLIGNDVEVTDTRRYNAWLSASWGIHSTTQSNKSTSFVTEESLPANEREYIRTMTGEDMKLYETIQDALSVAGKPSIDGRDLNAAAQKKT